MEAEEFYPLVGYNFSFTREDQTPRDTWSLAGPGVADAWTQGGESEFLSVAARSDAPADVTITKTVEVPAAGRYKLWVRYADYREKEELFGVRITQNANAVSHVFGRSPVVDELDPMKLLWGWAFAWDSAEFDLQPGRTLIEIYTTGPTGARRRIDCLCLTTDAGYHPTGREKPQFAVWSVLADWSRRGRPDVEPLLATAPKELARAWQIAKAPPAFLWNVGQPWLDLLKGNPGFDSAFGVDPPLQQDFAKEFHDKDPPVFSSPLSGPTWHIPMYPAVFSDGSPFIGWLERNKDRRFAVLLNYGEPAWRPENTPVATTQKLQQFRDQFIGYIAGESIAYEHVDNGELRRRVQSARSRSDVLIAMRELYTQAVIKKFAGYQGRTLSAEEAWGPVISCLSAGIEAYAHALCSWGVRRIGHENTGNSSTLARRLAFLRGAARQFGSGIVDYQSCNLGDSATMFSREAYFYPASSRYVLDNSYDAWAGAGVNWLLKDYLLFYLAGTDAFYNEQGVDIFWKPAGGVAGDSFPVQLSPKGKVAEAVQKIVSTHPRGTQYTPVAFLLDEAHGWAQERFYHSPFGLDPLMNPAILTPGEHEANIRGWFDIAYYPAPETQNEPASAIRQTYVNGIFGDIFDVIVTSAKHTDILRTYPVVIAAGEVSLSEEWGAALRSYVEKGGTLVVCDRQLNGAGVKDLSLPLTGTQKEGTAFTWSITGEAVQSSTFRYRPLSGTGNRILARAADGAPIAVMNTYGRGRIISVSIPLGLGIDRRPVPILGLLLKHLLQNLVPVNVKGDVEYLFNRLDDGGWLVALLNNRGIYKPEHGILPTDYKEAQTVSLRAPFPVSKSHEWMTATDQTWKNDSDHSSLTVTVPAGAVRLIALYSKAGR